MSECPAGHAGVMVSFSLSFSRVPTYFAPVDVVEQTAPGYLLLLLCAGARHRSGFLGSLNSRPTSIKSSISTCTA
jgi:hypothetical protein